MVVSEGWDDKALEERYTDSVTACSTILVIEAEVRTCSSTASWSDSTTWE